VRLEALGLSIKYFRYKDIDRDKILSASEALDYGLVDQVLSSRKSIVSR